jgi:hypothetical protein
MINIKYDGRTIANKRKAVVQELLKESANIKSGEINCISVSDLQILYKHYDRIFFNNWFGKNFKGQVLYELSKRMTKSAGITKCPKNISQLKPEQVRITITISVDFLFKFDYLDGSKLVCGIETHNNLEALQIVFEHELVHVLEFLLSHTSNCRGQRFKDTARNLFGHTQSHHQIPTNREIASKKLGINIGDKVQFLFKDKRLYGVVANINKRATVMVANPNGNYCDKNGARYMKYYVPLSELVKK